MAVMNVATYGFTMIAARLLGPQAYGALASLMATLLVITVLQLGLQATAARRIAAEPEHVAQIERTILGVTYRAAVALGVLLLAAGAGGRPGAAPRQPAHRRRCSRSCRCRSR